MMFWALAWPVLLFHLGYAEGSCKLHHAKWMNELEGPSVSQPNRSDPTKLMVDWSNMLQNQRCVDGYVVHLWQLLQSESQARKVRVSGPITADTNSFVVDVVPCMQYVFRVEFEQRGFWTGKLRGGKSGTTTSSTRGSPTIKDLGKHNFDVRLLFDELLGVHGLSKVVVSFNKSAVFNYPDCIDLLKIIGNLDDVTNYADVYKSSMPSNHNGSGVGRRGGSGQTYEAPGVGGAGGVFGTQGGAGEERVSKSPEHDPRDYQQSVRVKREATYYGSSSSAGEAGTTFGTHDHRDGNSGAGGSSGGETGATFSTHNHRDGSHSRGGGSSVGQSGRTFGTHDHHRDGNSGAGGSSGGETGGTFGTHDHRDGSHKRGSSVGEAGRTFGTHDENRDRRDHQSNFYGFGGSPPENYNQQSFRDDEFYNECLKPTDRETVLGQNLPLLFPPPYLHPDNDDRQYSYNDNRRPDYLDRHRNKREVGNGESGRQSHGSQGDTLNNGYSRGGDHSQDANHGSHGGHGYSTDGNIDRHQGSLGGTFNSGDGRRGSTGSRFGNGHSWGDAVQSRPDRRNNGRRSGNCNACRPNRGKREAMPTETVGGAKPPFADIVKIFVDVEPCKPYRFDLEVGKHQGSGIKVPFKRYRTDLRLPPVESQNNLEIPNLFRTYDLKADLPDSCFISYLNAINNQISTTDDELAWYYRQSQALEHLSLRDGKGKQVGLDAPSSSSQLLRRFGCKCHMSSLIRLNTTDGEALRYHQGAVGLYRASGKFHAGRPYYEKKISDTESYYVYYDKPGEMWYVDNTLGDASPKLYMDNNGEVDSCPADSDISGQGRQWYYSGTMLWKKIDSLKVSCGV